ncbi:MAG: hypothetical protein ACJ74O_15790 [Frankiaceae bacterium]
MAPVNVWTLVYRTDQHGEPLLGNVHQLRDAVLAGADVKVLYQSQPDGPWWSRSCSSAAVSGSGSGTLVSAVYMEAADTTVTPRGLAFSLPFAVEHQIYNSIGTRAMAKSVDGRVVTEEPEPLALKWFVKDYEIIPLNLSDRVVDMISHRFP